MPFEITDLHWGIAGALGFYLVIGRLLWDSFSDLFGQTLSAFFKGIFSMGPGDYNDWEDGEGKALLLLIGSVLFGLGVYFKLMRG